MLTVTALHTYPLKSGAGISLTQATVGPQGLEHDRRWMVVRRDGSFLSARELPALVLVRAVPMGGGLRLSAPGMPTLEVPAPSANTPRLTVEVWRDKCSAALAGEEAARWLARYLGQEALLVHADMRMERPVDPRYAAPEDRVGFSDGFPLLLMSEASLEELSQRVGRAMEMGRFRPNLVVAGCEAFAEDGWRRLRVGSAELVVAKPCARCVLTTVDPATGERSADGEPLRTLATFRRSSGKVMFGQNVLVRHPGTVQVGDAVEVLE